VYGRKICEDYVGVVMWDRPLVGAMRRGRMVGRSGGQGSPLSMSTSPSGAAECRWLLTRQPLLAV